jgi:hypothetical protein
VEIRFLSRLRGVEPKNVEGRLVRCQVSHHEAATPAAGLPAG